MSAFIGIAEIIAGKCGKEKGCTSAVYGTKFPAAIIIEKQRLKIRE